MKFCPFLLYLLLLSTSVLLAQKIDNTVSFRDINNERYFRFNYENDYFSATDENYTQGYNIELAMPSLQNNPLNFLFIKIKDNSAKYGLSLEHIGFTPNNYVSPEIQYGDRPFASAIMLKSFTIASDSINKIRFSQSLSFGLIGPAAFGKEMQVAIHKATGNKIPEGWKNQIKNDLVVNYRFGFERQVFNLLDFIELNSNATLQIGTLFTNVSAGAMFTVGWLDSIFTKKIDRKNFNLYFYSQPLVSVVGYDATLQGGLFNTGSPYTIASKNIERLTAQINYGLVLKSKTLFLEYSRSAITREYKTGNSTKWGGVIIGFTF